MNPTIIKQYFPKFYAEVEQGICPICHLKVNVRKFKDKLSKVEFRISGMCQECQDKMFK